MIKIKFKNLLILLKCFWYFFSRGKANKTSVNYKTIAVFQGAKLGDMVCTTPMFRAIKEKYPQTRLIVIGDAINEKVLEHNDDIDEYIVFKDLSFWELVSEIKKRNIDFACITAPDFLNLASLYLAGVPLISSPYILSGYSHYETKPYKILKNLVIQKPHHMGTYAPREYLRLLEAIEIYTDNTNKHLKFSREAEKSISNLFVKNNISKDDLLVGIAPGAGNKIKQWPPERFAEVAEYVIKNYGAKVIIIGGKNDLEEAKEMLSYLDDRNKVINTVGLVSIDELKTLISRLSMFVSVDTGSVYVAEAFGVPTIDIVGPMDEREQPPIGLLHRVVLPPNRYKPELHIMDARSFNKEEAKRQVDSITVQAVVGEINSLEFTKK